MNVYVYVYIYVYVRLGVRVRVRLNAETIKKCPRLQSVVRIEENTHCHTSFCKWDLVGLCVMIPRRRGMIPRRRGTIPRRSGIIPRRLGIMSRR